MRFANCQFLVVSQLRSYFRFIISSSFSTVCKRPQMELIPTDVRGMTLLDKTKFFKEISVPSVQVPNQNVGSALRILKKFILKISRLRPVMDVEGGECRKILLDPGLFTGPLQLDESEKATLEKLGVPEENFTNYNLRLEYENFKEDDIFRAVLPADKDGCSSYSRIGHIAHLNLKDHLLPYKLLIGQVLIDKLVGVRTVVNKSQTIESTYRNFQMELLAGEPDYVAEVKENRCTFKFDFSAVYWNSRLCTEHERIIKLLPEGAVLFDVFAGVGPFSIPAAKVRRCRVFSNDLNPSSHHWLSENVKLNNVKDKVTTFNLDGRDFIKTELKKYLLDSTRKEEPPVHITMNLPALAVEFLDAFVGLVPPDCPTLPEITVHVYSFCRDATTGDEMRGKVDAALSASGRSLTDSDVVELIDVRNVAPNKNMMRLSFKMPLEILSKVEDDSSVPAKKIKLDHDDL